MKTSQSLHVIGSVHCGTEVVEDSQSQSRFGSVEYYCFYRLGKSFDSLEWKYLFEVLEAMYFGQMFQTLIHVVCSNISRCVVDNGFGRK